jgi:hypothetical protein
MIKARGEYTVGRERGSLECCHPHHPWNFLSIAFLCRRYFSVHLIMSDSSCRFCWNTNLELVTTSFPRSDLKILNPSVGLASSFSYVISRVLVYQIFMLTMWVSFLLKDFPVLSFEPWVRSLCISSTAFYDPQSSHPEF